jgi:hypothetical protein
MLRLAGIDLTEESVLALVVRLRRADLDEQADRIVHELMSMQTEVTLRDPDRIAILTVLDDPPDGLAELRGVLLRERVGAERDGVV